MLDKFDMPESPLHLSDCLFKTDHSPLGQELLLSEAPGLVDVLVVIPKLGLNLSGGKREYEVLS